ncbi:MAG: cytochrome c oxidase assembly factor Coa1 family protein [Methyloligellaceae bacterium]
MEQQQQYISGQGKASVLPPELHRWNWGAFFLNWIWGIGNNTYIALLMFVPLVNVVMLFVLGAKGNKWAWQNVTWRDVEHFRRVQRNWAKVGFGIFVGIILFFIGMIFLIGNLLKGEAYEKSLQKVKSNPEIIQLLGQPIQQTGFIMGSFNTNGARGYTAISYSVTGPKGSATVYVEAIKNIGPWELKKVLVHIPKTDRKILIVPARSVKLQGVRKLIF